MNLEQGTITLVGKIYFDPDSKTAKHNKQGSWKKIAMVFIEGGKKNDITKYYAWFIKNKYGIDLTEPLRGAHISFINDRESDTNGKWEEVKNKWHKKKVEIVLSVVPHYSDSGEHWWLIVPHAERNGLQSIRNELGLGKPHFGMHMTIGKAVDKRPEEKNDAGATTAKVMNAENSKRVVNAIKKGWIS